MRFTLRGMFVWMSLLTVELVAVFRVCDWLSESRYLLDMVVTFNYWMQ